MHKSELAALDRKITAELAPKHDENDGTENKQEQSKEVSPTVKVEPSDTSQSQKPSMVAEPANNYNQRAPLNSRIIIGGFSANTKRQADNRIRPKL